mmetsp:Transcript_16952/g.24005  ORF Transcript_16952/g.24005 Transcript_16952/m.24005 type:complete len:113 (-) Transcript_16952:1566-1904(-)
MEYSFSLTLPLFYPPTFYTHKMPWCSTMLQQTTYASTHTHTLQISIMSMSHNYTRILNLKKNVRVISTLLCLDMKQKNIGRKKYQEARVCVMFLVLSFLVPNNYTLSPSSSS